MKAKNKSLGYILAMAITFVIMVGSIGLATWAMIRTKLDVGGNISFTGTGDILATISKGDVIGGTLKNADADDRMQQIDIAAGYDEESSQVKLDSWKGLEVSIPENGSDVIINFTITNNSADKALQVSVTSSFTSAQNMTMKVLANGAEMTGPENINMQACQHFQIHFKVTDDNNPASMSDFKANFNLVNTEGLPASGTDVLSFTEAAGGYSVSLLDASTASGTIVIPATYNTKPVVSIANFKNATGITSVIIPTSVKSIGSFSGCSGLTSIAIPSGVTSIGNSAFLGCSGLTSITIPSSVTSIGGYAFERCSSLTSAILSNGATSIEGSAFYGCSGLTSITIPSSVSSIGSLALGNCSGLTSITISNGVISIGESAFYGCSELTSITIPSSVTSIGESAFGGCGGLTSITVASRNTKYHSADNCIVETASKTLIAGCKTSVIPTDGSVTSIGNDAFAGCSSLTSITIPSGVTSIGANAFNGCSSLTSITIPSGVTSIGSSAFRSCSSLSSITISSTVRSIGDYAFWYCNSLTSITIPGEIGVQAFRECTGLTSVIISEGATSIKEFAFYMCSNLESITIASSVTRIERGAFSKCDKLTSASFVDTTGWWVSTDSAATSGTSISSALSNTSTAATCLRSTYCNYYWNKG